MYGLWPDYMELRNQLMCSSLGKTISLILRILYLPVLLSIGLRHSELFLFIFFLRLGLNIMQGRTGSFHEAHIVPDITAFHLCNLATCLRSLWHHTLLKFLFLPFLLHLLQDSNYLTGMYMGIFSQHKLLTLKNRCSICCIMLLPSRLDSLFCVITEPTATAPAYERCW